MSFHVKLSNLQWSSSSSTFNQILSFKFPINNEGTISWAHIAGILNLESWIIDFEYAFPCWCYLGILIFLILHIEQKYFNIEPLKFWIPTFSEVLIVISSSCYWGCSCFNILTTAANIKTSAIIKRTSTVRSDIRSSRILVAMSPNRFESLSYWSLLSYFCLFFLPSALIVSNIYIYIYIYI